MSRRRAQGRNWSLVAGVGAAGLILGYLVGVGGRTEAPATPPAPERPASKAPARPEPEAVVPSSSPPAAEPAPPAPADTLVELPPIPRGEGRKIALVIDDLGRRVQDVADLYGLGVPLSFGVLPFETRTAEVAAELERRGAEVLLHLPMEPSNGKDPGPGALTSDMTGPELEAATRWALEAVAGARGVNNHMGSELSTDADSMRAILGVLAERQLFFLDSRTSPDSVGYTVAREMGLAAAERQVFLDADIDPESVRFQFRRLLEVAHLRGRAVAIAHPHADTIAVLREEIPLAVAAGFEFVPVSRLTRRADPPRLSR